MVLFLSVQETKISGKTAKSGSGSKKCVCYVWNLENRYWWAYLRTGKRRRHGEWTCGHSGRRRGWDELRGERLNIYITICKIASRKLPYNTRSSTQWSVTTRRSGMGWGKWGGGSRGRGHMLYLWLIHVAVWHCKAIILQLKIRKNSKNNWVCFPKLSELDWGSVPPEEVNLGEIICFLDLRTGNGKKKMTNRGQRAAAAEGRQCKLWVESMV